MGPIKSILDANEYELSVIVSWLDFITKMKLRRVCRTWKRQIESTYFCKSVNLEKHAADISNKFVKSMVLFTGKTLAYLNISNCGRITDDGIGLICINCPHISKLIMSNCWKLSDTSLQHIGLHLTLIEQLDISHCNKFVGHGFQGHNMNQLIRFNASYCKAFSDKSLEKLLVTTPDMAEVRIRRCTRLTEFGIFLIIRFCRKLELLDLRDCELVTDRCLKWVATSCFHLQSFNLSFCSKLTQAGFADFANGLQLYKSLDLSNCSQLGDSSIILLKGCIKELRYLSLRNCIKITDTIASHLAVYARKLRLLDLTGCPRITPAFERLIKTINPKVTIIVTKSLQQRKIYVPGHPLAGKPKAMEIGLRDLYTSGPKELMEFGQLGNNMPKAQDLNVRKFLRHVAKKGARKQAKMMASADKSSESPSLVD